MGDLSLDDLLKNQPTKELKPISENEAQLIAKEDIKELSPEDQMKVDQIKSELDLRDSSLSTLFASDAQKNIAQFSDEVLSQVKAKDADEVGVLMTNLLVKVQNVSVEEKKGFFSKIFGAGKTKLETFLANYEDLSGQIDGISAKLQMEQKGLMKQVELFDRLYQQNLDYYRDLEIYIEAGQQKVQEMKEVTLPKLYQEAGSSDNPMAMQVVNDLDANVSRFEKKVHDLKISQTIALQAAPQIKLIQNNDQMLINKIGDAINNTIPLWKSQIVIALGLAKQEKALEMQKAISEATNKMIQDNAKKLKQTSLSVQEEAERSIVDVETLEMANKELIETIQGSVEISRKAEEQRKVAEDKMLQMKEDLRKALAAAME